MVTAQPLPESVALRSDWDLMVATAVRSLRRSLRA